MKLKTLDYLAAGLPVVGTTEAVVGLEQPDRFALLSHDPAMRDLPELVNRLIADAELRLQLGHRGRRVIAERYSWHAVARSARHAYQAIAASRATRGTRTRPDRHIIPREVTTLAQRTPYWLAEWRSRDPRPKDASRLADHTKHTSGRDQPTRVGPSSSADELAEAINCTRLAALAALDIRFDADAASGYAGRSMVFFAPSAILKVYTHRAAERAQREIAGIALAAAHARHIRVASILGHDDVPGGLSWVATTRLAGTQPSTRDLTDPACSAILGRVAARLHAIPVAHVDTLSPHVRRIRPLPTGDAVATEVARSLAVAVAAAEPRERPRCKHGFVHGDLSSRNILLAADRSPAVIDFEGSGAGCIYDDVATLVMQDGLLGPADPEQLISGYEAERSTLWHRTPAVDRDHLALHLATRARWILQWAFEKDRPLAEAVLNLAPALLTDLARQSPEATP